MKTLKNIFYTLWISAYVVLALFVSGCVVYALTDITAIYDGRQITTAQKVQLVDMAQHSIQRAERNMLVECLKDPMKTQCVVARRLY